MAKIGNRTAPGRYTIGSWKEQTAADAQSLLERKAISTARMTVVRCSYVSGASFRSHTHPQEQITIVEKGSLIFEIDGDVVVVEAGQMIAIPPRVRHSTRTTHESAEALNLFLVDPVPAALIPERKKEAYSA